MPLVKNCTTPPFRYPTTPLVHRARITSAKLAANRANSLKSTGPRSAAGKRRSSMNAWRHGWRTQVRSSCIPDRGREALAFARFKRALRLAVLPAEGEVGEDLLRRIAAATWKVKRNYDRWLAARSDEEFFLLDAGALPRPGGWRLRLQRTDWQVTISVWVRRNRPAEAGMIDHPRQHTVIKLTCVRHPWFAEAGSRAVDVGGFNGLEEPPDTRGITGDPDAAGGELPSLDSSQPKTATTPASEPQRAIDERSHDVDEGQGLAKMSRGRRRRLGFERAPHGIGCLGLRKAGKEEPPEPQEPWRHPRGAPGADPIDATPAVRVRRWVPAGAEPAPARATNEATMLQKTSVFKKCLGIPLRRFWQDLGKRALDSLRTRLLRGSHSPEGGNSGHLKAPTGHSAGRGSPVDAGLPETDRSW